MGTGQKTNDFLRNLWRWKCGLSEETPTRPKTGMTFYELSDTEWNVEFEQFMRNRLVMGAYRYGRIKERDKPPYDRLTSMVRRLELYKETGNKEYLVDVATLCLVEFTLEGHPTSHFNSVDDGEHVRVKYHGD